MNNSLRYGLSMLFLILFASFSINLNVNAEVFTFDVVNVMADSAKTSRADLFSPVFFKKGMTLYQRAEKSHQLGGKSNSIEEKLEKSYLLLLKSRDIAQRFEASFPNLVSKYDSAIAIGANEAVPKLWKRATKLIEKTARSFEKEKIESAKKSVVSTNLLLDQVLINATIEVVLGDAKREYTKILHTDAPKIVPASFAKLSELIEFTEDQLTDGACSKDSLIRMVQDVDRQISEVVFIARKVRALKRGAAGYETLILEYQVNIQRICELLAVSPKFNQALFVTTESVTAAIRDIQEDNRYYKNRIISKDNQIGEFEAEIQRLHGQTGKYISELEFNRRQIQDKQSFEAKIKRITTLLQPSQGTIFYTSKGDLTEIFIRLSEVEFKSGSSQLTSESTYLLDIVNQITDEFPRCTVEIHGHTDSHGSDSYNLRLSQQRAESVKSYLFLNNEHLYNRIQALGFGETIPISSNETSKGREDNRRIEIILKNIDER